MAPAKTGSDNSNKIVVIMIDHRNKGIRSKYISFGRTLRIVVIKLIAPRIEDTPAK